LWRFLSKFLVAFHGSKSAEYFSGMTLPNLLSNSGGAPDAAALHRKIAEFVGNGSIETTPRESAAIASYRNFLRPGMTVNVAFLPDAHFDDTILTCARLRREGFNPVPHLPARAFASEAALRDVLRQLESKAAVTNVLVVAGGLNDPLGPFPDTMSVLGTGLLERHGISRIGVAGHPEGSPDINAETLRVSLAMKAAFSARPGIEMHFATQFCLDAAPILSWEYATRQDGNSLPVDVGLAGATTLKSLLKFAKLCGVGASRRMLARNSKKLIRLGSISYPDRLITALASQMLIDPACRFRRPHFFPFGGLERTAQWLESVAAGAFTLNRDLTGFQMTC
jgi:methylenetetrahydrofolate reductase (NADPH)